MSDVVDSLYMMPYDDVVRLMAHYLEEYVARKDTKEMRDEVIATLAKWKELCVSAGLSVSA